MKCRATRGTAGTTVNRRGVCTHRGFAQGIEVFWTCKAYDLLHRAIGRSRAGASDSSPVSENVESELRRRPGELQIQMVASPRNQRYLQ